MPKGHNQEGINKGKDQSGNQMPGQNEKPKGQVMKRINGKEGDKNEATDQSSDKKGSSAV
jgi:hypothetical protein